MDAETKELMAQWVQTFQPADRLTAAIVFEEKPDVIIRKVPDAYKEYYVDSETEFFIMTQEFGDRFWLESGLTFMDAIDFCYMFGVNYEVQV